MTTKIYTTAIGYESKNLRKDFMMADAVVATSIDHARGIAVGRVMARKEEEPQIWAIDVFEVADEFIPKAYPHLFPPTPPRAEQAKP